KPMFTARRIAFATACVGLLLAALPATRPASAAPDTASEQIARGDQLYAQAKLGEARTAYMAALMAEPRNFGALYRMAQGEPERDRAHGRERRPGRSAQGSFDGERGARSREGGRARAELREPPSRAGAHVHDAQAHGRGTSRAGEGGGAATDQQPSRSDLP